MKKTLLTILSAAALTTSFGQLSGTTVEIVKTHNATDIPEVAGYVTYRVWANTVNENDFISMVYGNTFESPGVTVTEPMAFSLTSGQVFQSNLGNHMPPMCSVFSVSPAAEYDSYFTIGSECSGNPEESIMPVSTVPAGFFNSFESGVSSSANEGGFFTVQSFTNGWSGESKKVLLAQFTTNGAWQFCFSVQGQISGIPGAENTFQSIDICASSAQGVGVQDLPSAATSSVSVFPNPCADKFFAELSAPANITIYDLLGKQVDFRVLQAGRHEFDMVGQQDGVYVVVIKTEDETVTKRLVKH